MKLKSTYKLYWVIGLVFMLCSVHLMAQNCGVPFNIKFDNRTTTSIDISWSDTNITPEGWELEIVTKGQSRTGIPNLPFITQKKTTLKNLIPSTSYEIYIRTVCSAGKYSNWNVAIPFTTVLEIPTACHINIPLKDNGTETLLLDIKANGILGKDVFLESVDIKVEHDWPADLAITLVSPQGQKLLLSNHNGSKSDDFGDILEDGCSRVTSFSPEACTSLKTTNPPYIGSFKPDGDISDWKLDTLSKGPWKLIFFDRALKDVGTLKYLDVKFNNESCLVPKNFMVTQTQLNSISVGWDHEQPCETVILYIFEAGIPQDTFFIECKERKYTFMNLLPNTRYDFIITSACLSSLSQESCKITGFTTCEAVSTGESFDLLKKCTEGCASKCEISPSIWFNAANDSDQNWIIWNGKTDTENTGPNGDINGNGKYIYIENNPQICNINNKVVLQSTCMEIKSNESGCDMSFYYHLYGTDVESLTLEISVDNGLNWQQLYHVSGNQGDEWKRVTISLEKFNERIGIFRFVAETASGPLGDISLDQIEFYKSLPQTNPSIFYADNDNDGFGNEQVKLEACLNMPPTGYVSVAGDCDDNNADIHPQSIEIQCNGIDENCNGNVDDHPDVNPILITPTIINATCNGSKDGQITLNIIGGTAPYQVTWNVPNKSGHILENIGEGVYFAEIKDAGGCVINTNFFQINATTSLNVIATEIKSPSCQGKSDGAISIGHNTQNAPYTYLWSNGLSTKNIMQTTEGIYSVTVTDANQCYSILSNIALIAEQSILVDIKSIKHPTCRNDKNGHIELFTISGSPPYSYAWNNGSSADHIANLSSGSYTCTVTDQNKCQNIFKATISQPDSIVIDVISTEDTRCFGESNGSIKTNIQGGKPPYTFLWNNQSQRADDIFNLEAGHYILTVTDAVGCTNVSDTIIISEPEIFEIKIDSLSPASCPKGENGYISLSASGGNGSYTYVWSHTEISAESFSDMISNNYSITAYDKLGCKSSLPNIFLRYVNVDLGVNIELIQDNLCFNETNGRISASVQGGKSPFDYNWSHGVQYFDPSPLDTMTQLGAGIYTLVVTDSDGCTGKSESMIIAEKTPFSYNVNSIINNICQNDSLGVIEIVPTGGVSPIGIIWNGGLYAGSKISGLPNGLYTGQIQDGNNCKLSITQIPITSNSNIELHTTIINDTENAGNGSICIDPVGGFSPYSISWSTGDINQECISKLRKGSYRVTVSDGLGCQVEASYIVDNVSTTSDHQKLKIIAYPNPAQNTLHITTNYLLENIKFYQINGTLVKENDKIIDLQFSQDISDLPPGLYIIKMKSASGISYFKLIKI